MTLVVTLAFVCTPVRAALFRDEKHRFQVHVAPMWKPLPDSVSAQLAQAIANQGGPVPQVLAGYSQASSTQPVPPFFMIFFVEADQRGQTIEQLETALIRGVKTGMSTAARDRGFNFGTFNPTFDRAKRRLNGSTDIEAGGVKLTCTIAGYIVADGMVAFALYSKPEAAVKDKANLDLALMSFKVDPGAEFVPAPPGTQSTGRPASRGRTGANAAAYEAGRTVGTIVGFALVFGLIGGVVGGVVWIVRKLTRR